MHKGASPQTFGSAIADVCGAQDSRKKIVWQNMKIES